MPKIKTHKATAKRVKKTKNNKFMTRKVGQDHFNARESSRMTMNKRRDVIVSRTNLKAIKKAIPNYKLKKYAS